jgi:small subunit ribosomal protein S13
MLDSLSPFKKKRHILRQLNCYQFFTSRFGIGKTLSDLLCAFSGLHPHLRAHLFLDIYFNSFYSHFYILKKIKNFFLINKNKLDHFLHKEIISYISILKTIRCLKGRKHTSHLPIRGQRNRTNARTQKNIFLGIDDRKKKNKKKIDLVKPTDQKINMKNRNNKSVKNINKKTGKKSNKKS